MKTKGILFILILIASSAFALYSSYRWPVDLSPSLTGTFGEQRGKYFHSGIDIKTEGRIGHPVFAIDNGYVYSITSRDIGYGNSLLLHHGNVLSHYAHLDSFVEGTYNLNSTIEIIKLLYENDVENFIFKHMRIFFKKGDLIAKSGETGAGPPHLHFAIRDSGGAINPLQFFQIRDTEAPVIRAITFCIEKENSTIFSETVRVHNRWGRFIPEKKVFTAFPDARCFVKVSCFDRVNGRNRCAVYKISLIENTTTIFEIDFSNFRWNENPMAQFIFDSSMPAIAGETLYTYFLCQREGNVFSRIRAKDGGYIKAGDTKKHFTIKVSDFAGNESTVEFVVEKEDSNNHIGSDFKKAFAKKTSTFSDHTGNFTITYPKRALLKDALVKISASTQHPLVEKLIAAKILHESEIITVYSVFPFDQVLAQHATIAISRPEWISKEEANNILIYRSFDETTPTALLTHYNSAKDAFLAETNAHGHFFLLRDRTAPTIFLPPFHDCVVDKGPYRILRLYFTDDLSGINSKSILVYIDGFKYPAEFDYDRNWVEIKLPKNAILQGIHHLFVRAKDRANNVGYFRSVFAF
ncbi:MAG: M23 family metallopeptidase [Spirochaetes bacterium]|nr:M23 family metallopeptidase [Spirochaetota bacterium]